MKEDTIYYVRKPQITYGIQIGILLLECYIPYIPGMIGNATTFKYPVRYKVVRGASINRIINERDPKLIEPFIESGKELIAEGVQAVTGNCGFVALFQKQIAEELNVPVFMSSILLVPLISRMLRAHEKVAIVTADASNLDDSILQAAGISNEIGIHLCDLNKSVHFQESILQEGGTLNANILENEVLEIIEDELRDDPLIKAIVLECTDIPPFAYAIQEKIGLPVFDIVSLIDFVYNGLTRKPYRGQI